jgi:hypothetical protein
MEVDVRREQRMKDVVNDGVLLAFSGGLPGVIVR